MSKIKNQKIRKLLQDPRKLYHAQDLAVLWGIDNSNTLYTTIKRYMNRGILNKIHKGFYSTVSIGELNSSKKAEAEAWIRMLENKFDKHNF